MLELTVKGENGQEEGLLKLAGSNELADGEIVTDSGDVIPIHLGLLARYFNSQENLANYLGNISQGYSIDSILSALQALYRGYGRIEDPVLGCLDIPLP